MSDKNINVLLNQAKKARELNVSIESLRRWRRDGKGPKCITYGGIVRYFLETP